MLLITRLTAWPQLILGFLLGVLIFHSNKLQLCKIIKKKKNCVLYIDQRRRNGNFYQLVKLEKGGGKREKEKAVAVKKECNY